MKSSDFPETRADPPSHDPQDARVLEVMQEYMAQLEAGKKPNRKEFIARHPDLAPQLSACLQGLTFVNRALEPEPSTGDAARGRVLPWSPDASGKCMLGDFELVRELGRGGMGVVYEAVQVSLARKVAVKVLPFAAALDSRHIQRFKNEAHMAAQLHHTNIVPVFAVGSERSVHYYAMQLIEGQSLADLIRQLRAASGRGESRGAGDWGATKSEHGLTKADDGSVAAMRRPQAAGADADPLPLSFLEDKPSADQSFASSLTTLRSAKRSTYYQAIARLVMQAADALEYAHRQGVVHRDIKPANLILDLHGTLWVTDFGLAQLYAESNLTQPGDMIGTFRYMSPEQASGKAVVLDQRTDVYSLGLTMYELLTLESGVTGESRQEILNHIENVDPVPARAVDRTIPVELETIVAKAIAKDPAERYQSAAVLREDLQRYLRDEPILARPPSLPEKMAKWLRRHKSLTRSAVAVALVALAAMTVATVLISREEDRTQQAYEREQAQRQRADRSAAEARQAVDYFTRVAAEDLPKMPQLIEIKEDLLRTAAAYYENFLAENKNDPKLEKELATAQQNVDAILGELRSVQETRLLQTDVDLLKEKSVQHDLGLNAEQIGRLKKLFEDSALPLPRNADGDPLTSQQMQDQLSTYLQRGRAELHGILTPHQVTRLREISRQLRGAEALRDMDVVSALSLTAEQRQAMQQLRKRLDDSGPSDHDPESETNKTKQVMSQTLALLTPKQRQTWAALTGKPFQGHVHVHFDGPPGHHEPPGPPDGDH